jgi:hypothetical protein
VPSYVAARCVQVLSGTALVPRRSRSVLPVRMLPLGLLVPVLE